MWNKDEMRTSGTAGATTTAGTTGTTAIEPAGSGTEHSASTWWLSGGSDLDKHVGHKVQVTGRASSASASAPGTTAGTTAGSTSATGTTASSADKMMSGAQQKLEVQSVKMIASSCS